MDKNKKVKILEAFQPIAYKYIPLIDFHLHTNWTDGHNNEMEMYFQASVLGLEYILFSEHVRRTSSEWFGRFANSIKQLPFNSCKAYVGAETKVSDYNGNIDCSITIIDNCDFVIASVHRFPDKLNLEPIEFKNVPAEEAIELEYQLSIRVLDNPDVDILGHPFGMCLSRYNIIPPVELFGALAKKAAINGVAIEVNSSYNPYPWDLIKLCKNEGALVTLGSDAHCIEDVGKVVRILKGE
ncbi:MAG: PHP domain-containing protein [Syntrophomonas sp.]